MAAKQEDVKIGGMGFGRSPLVYVLGVFLFIGIPVGTFYFNYQKNSQASNDRSKEEIEAATARTLLVQGHDRDIVSHRKKLAEHDTTLRGHVTRVGLLENFQVDAKGRLDRAEAAVAENTEQQKQQRQRALIREGDRKVRDKKIEQNTNDIKSLENKLSAKLGKEIKEYRATAKRLQLERQQLLLQIQSLKRDLGDKVKRTFFKTQQ